MRELVFATNNANKLKEIRAVLGDKVNVISLQELGVNEDIPETRNTLEGNALQKAEFVIDRHDVACFADDTGLEITALDGRPGVFSARYAGPACSADDNMAKVLAELEGESDRSARFRTVIALIMDGQEHLFEGTVEGQIIAERTGDEGFGYDPIFRPDGHERTFAQMDMETKNGISHRGKAVAKLAAFIAGLDDK